MQICWIPILAARLCTCQGFIVMVDKEFYLMSYFKVYSVSLLEVVVRWNLEILAEAIFYSEIMPLRLPLSLYTLQEEFSAKLCTKMQVLGFLFNIRRCHFVSHERMMIVLCNTLVFDRPWVSRGKCLPRSAMLRRPPWKKRTFLTNRLFCLCF
jgi:hypothetical protein